MIPTIKPNRIHVPSTIFLVIWYFIAFLLIFKYLVMIKGIASYGVTPRLAFAYKAIPKARQITPKKPNNKFRMNMLDPKNQLL